MLPLSLTPRELESIAVHHIVKIIPLVKLPRLELIGGTYGPFEPPRRQSVPLWIALMMKRSGRCSIQPPDWLDYEYLREKVDEEKREPGFSRLPFHYIEISHLLITHAPDDIPRVSGCIELIKELRDLRQRKAHAGLKFLTADLVAQNGQLAMEGLSFMEINEIKPIFTKAYNELRMLVPRDGAM